jgi:hypothetical protein
MGVKNESAVFNQSKNRFFCNLKRKGSKLSLRAFIDVE